MYFVRAFVCTVGPRKCAFVYAGEKKYYLCQAQSTDLRDLPIAQRNLRFHTLRN